MKTMPVICAVVTALFAASALPTETSAQQQTGTVPVTVDNFIRAESHMYFGGVALKEGGFGKFEHHRELASIDAQNVVRMNRDTLYSATVLDLDAGPATITLPDAGKRFMSMQVIDEDEYTPMVVYSRGSYALTKENIGTRYVL